MTADSPNDQAAEDPVDGLKDALETTERKEVARAEAEIDSVLEGTVEDPKQRQVLKRIFTLARQQQQYTGPVPSPEMLEGFRRVMPDLPGRLIAAWEKETEFRHQMEREEQSLRKAALGSDISTRASEIEIRQTSQKHAFFIVLALLAIGATLGYTDHDWLSGVIFGTTIISVLIIYILGRMPSKPSDDDAKSD